ncbi:tropinone reductase-like isoform X2 [Zingiber officinale]|uniref:tropinone reductase-like isoform X2 n=1 Tax=Zingiber officinale TaxID=94328 RepID=UPI001C4B7314|nr:tropinone reductase-like isoform X2 [Zingiber officinale]
MSSVQEHAPIDTNRWSLAGTTALVTGGSKGIGYAIVEELARLGSAVHTCARSQADLEKCLQEWRGSKLKVTGSVCDVSSPSEREKLMATVKSQFDGKLNILVNNAGTAIFKPAMEQTPEDFKLLISTNLESAFHLSQLAYPLLKACGGGSIVFITSISAFIAWDHVSVYASTKVGARRGICGEGESSRASWAFGGAGGCGRRRGLPLPPSFLLREWSGHRRRWR